MNPNELIERLDWLKEYEHVSIANIAADAIAALRELQADLNDADATCDRLRIERDDLKAELESADSWVFRPGKPRGQGDR